MDIPAFSISNGIFKSNIKIGTAKNNQENKRICTRKIHDVCMTLRMHACKKACMHTCM